MTKWPQKFLLTQSIVVMVILIFVSNLAVGCSLRYIDYPVRVLAKDTDEAVANAEVTIEVRGKAPLDGITDSNGWAKIFIYSSYAGKPAELVVRATGYETHRQHIDLTKDALPDTILLVGPGEVVVSGPKHTATPTATPEPTPASKLTPTSTSIMAGILPPSYPAPILVNPAYGATIVGETSTNFFWHWDGILQEEEKYDLRIWRLAEPYYTVAMLCECSHILDAPPDGFGQYLWQVAIVRIESGNKLTLSESPIWLFVWSDVPTVPPTNTPEPTSTAIPKPIPTPDAVVNAKNLNLRFGPDTVYNVLVVLKRGDPLKVTGKNLAGDWLKVIAPDEQEGWVVCSLLKVNVDMAGVPVAQAPPTPTPTYTSTPIGTPTPTLLPPPILTEPENGAAFLGEPVVLRWRWDRPRAPDEVFSVRVHREGETKLCHHAQAKDLEYKGSLTYCTAGYHYWGVALARDLAPWLPEDDENRWRTLSKPSEERWFYYVPSDEPWTWPTLDIPGPGPGPGPGPSPGDDD